MSAVQGKICSLGALVAGIDAQLPAQDVQVSGLRLDSRQVQPGDLFIAVKGVQHDGVTFIAQAVANGAAAVVVDQTVAVESSVPLVRVNNLAEFISDIAGAFYGHPSHALRVTGITGTNGKTTCSQLLARLLEQLGEPSAFIGTMGYALARPAAELVDTGLTTPDAIAVQRIMAELAAQGARQICMEVSSHSLDQRRVAGVAMDTAIFTNLSHDHLDYHGDFNSYAAAKSRLFAMQGLSQAVVNWDDPVGRLILANLAADVQGISYSLEDAEAAVYCSNITLDSNGLRATIHSPWGRGELVSQLYGRFNLANLLAVISAACLQGFSLQDVLAKVPGLTAVCGRMELLNPHSGPHVVVDYAHTPDALEKALAALRVHCDGQLWCLVGCGGDRDRAKRPLMGAIAERGADHVLVTSDNPRTEQPMQIIEDILRGINDRAAVAVEVDRATAIRRAICQAKPRDVVLVAGKGHEDYQIIGTQKLPFSDQQQAFAALRERGAA